MFVCNLLNVHHILTDLRQGVNVCETAVMWVSMV